MKRLSAKRHKRERQPLILCSAEPIATDLERLPKHGLGCRQRLQGGDDLPGLESALRGTARRHLLALLEGSS